MDLNDEKVLAQLEAEFLPVTVGAYTFAQAANEGEEGYIWYVDERECSKFVEVMLDDRKPPRMLAFGEKEKKDPKIEKVDSGERRLRNGREAEPDITYFYLDGIQAGQCTI